MTWCSSPTTSGPMPARCCSSQLRARHRAHPARHVRAQRLPAQSRDARPGSRDACPAERRSDGARPWRRAHAWGVRRLRSANGARPGAQSAPRRVRRDHARPARRPHRRAPQRPVRPARRCHRLAGRTGTPSDPRGRQRRAPAHARWIARRHHRVHGLGAQAGGRSPPRRALRHRRARRRNGVRAGRAALGRDRNRAQRARASGRRHRRPCAGGGAAGFKTWRG